jgi:alpha-L-rhamnosidase
MGSAGQYHVGTYRLVRLLHLFLQFELLSFSFFVSPQRDERRGWMGDAALSVNEALYNFDLIKFYLNFLNLISDQQLSNGAIPDVVPNGGGYPADPNWGTALPTITWQLYRHYGDNQVLADYYDHVRGYVENVRSGYNNTGLANLAYQFGDWVPPPPQPMTNQHLIASFAFLHDVSVLINMSQVLGKTTDTQAYSAFYQQLAEEFHRVFYTTASNCYADGMQAAQVLALALPNVVPDNVRGSVFDRLVSDITGKGNHVSTGIVSTAQLYPLLSDNGHHDLALELISSTTYPSYGYMFTNPFENATTIWELWNAPSEGPVMNSRNHIMYGSVGAWFYSHLAGIDLSSSMITIRPRMASEAKKHLMAKINCELSTLYGLVHVSYTRDERDTVANSILVRVTIPPNARAHVMFEPLFTGGHCVTLIEGDKIIWSANNIPTHLQGFEVERDVTGLMTVHVGSGQYEFQALWE